MELKKLKALVEAVPTGIAAEIDQLKRMFDNMESSIEAVQKWANGQLLSNSLKRHGHPETESKAFKDAVKKMHGEFEDLKMALISPLQSKVDEAIEQKPMTPAKEEKAIGKILGNAEDVLSYEARYKSWDISTSEKFIDWVTQESSPEESKDAARTIAKLLRKAGIAKGYTVRVVIRDNYRGKDTKWHSKVKV